MNFFINIFFHTLHGILPNRRGRLLLTLDLHHNHYYLRNVIATWYTTFIIFHELQLLSLASINFHVRAELPRASMSFHGSSGMCSMEAMEASMEEEGSSGFHGSFQPKPYQRNLLGWGDWEDSTTVDGCACRYSRSLCLEIH